MPFQPFLRSGLRVATLACLIGSSLMAQAPTHYLVQRDTVRYELVNPFRMYWVRGADTVGDRVREVSVETHVWSGTPTQPAVRVAFQSLGVNRFAKTNDYVMTPGGRVVTIDGAPPAPGSRGDLLTPLPAEPLRVGVRWTDTTGTGPGKGTVGEEHDEAIRTYEVARVFDTLGTRVADVRGTGTWHMRLSYWVDSAAGRTAWLDVKGPMLEHDLVDVTRGLLLVRAWKMDLRGQGVPPSGSVDTVAAGLLSEETMRASDSPRTRFLLRALPGTDSAVTVEPTHNAPILLHTVGRYEGGITASLTRNDGMVGVAHATFDGAAPRTYKATWADTSEMLVTQSVSRDGSHLTVRRSGARDTTLVVPNGAWGVADYSMQELLAPALLALPRDEAPHPFAVYRPFAGHWDAGVAVLRERAGVLVCVLKFESDAPEILVLTPEGDYLYGENSGPSTAKRFPFGSARQAKVRSLLASLNGGD